MYYAATYFTNKKEDKQIISQFLAYFQLHNNKFSFYRIYRKKLTFSSVDKNQMWNILVLLNAEEEEYYDHFKQAFNNYRTKLVRQETMLPTPGSFFPSNEKNGNIQIVEYVNVQQKYLLEFKNIMIHNNGPAMEHILHTKKWCKEFIALETADVLYHKAGFPEWNQIHLIAMRPSGVFHFKKDFNEGLVRVNAPNFADNFDRLEQIREFTSKVSASREI
ncbi:hypothetical protein [Niallia taxi]|uniref:Uncharacterized protein n=1 Tax=Niallia taxi TaxID=2499688 RepID=A0A437KC04_9BACI|nr:hypothetical protein [Niallia taxi]MCM3217702.1 hypothetical protein [Niallia taxi]MED4054882.1 hypothetical protein [Niallia taxi]MED4121106.1 hypothetical protein [Niallia taxi]RVT63645.1 hypothetical protein EM808_10280 [Niallia taxi]